MRNAKLEAQMGELTKLVADEYNGVMTCGEAEALARVFRTFGFPLVSAIILESHAKDDSPGDEHHLQNL